MSLEYWLIKQNKEWKTKITAYKNKLTHNEETLVLGLVSSSKVSSQSAECSPKYIHENEFRNNDAISIVCVEYRPKKESFRFRQIERKLHYLAGTKILIIYSYLECARKRRDFFSVDANICDGYNKKHMTNILFEMAEIDANV